MSFEANPVEYLLMLGEKNRNAYQVILGCDSVYRHPDVVMFRNDREALLNINQECGVLADQKKDCKLIYPDPVFGPRVVSLFSPPHCHTMWVFFQDQSASESYQHVAAKHFPRQNRQIRLESEQADRRDSLNQANITFHQSPKRRPGKRSGPQVFKPNSLPSV